MSSTTQILAVDTSTDACSVAVYSHGKMITENQLAPKAHTQILLPMVQRVLAQSGVSLSELDAFAFGRGPGSFTGIRIACSLVQAFGYAFEKPIVPVSTLQALAANAFRTLGYKAVMASLDARMGAVYWGLFKANEAGIMRAFSEEKRDQLTDIKLPSGDWEKVSGYPLAEDIAYLAVVEYEAGKAVLPEAVELTYL